MLNAVQRQRERESERGRKWTVLGASEKNRVKAQVERLCKKNT